MVLRRAQAAWLRKLFAGLLLCIVPLVCTTATAGDAYQLKFATLAPSGTTWVNLLEEWAEQVKQESDGRLVFKIYPGGVQGDEPDVLKKIRFGQLQGGAFTGYGIGHIFSPTRVLELPFLFNDIEEIDYVRRRLMPEIAQGYRDNGYELLGWMEVGYIYFFSQQPITSLDDLKQRRIWHWQGDPLGSAFFNASGLAPVPLSIIDVYTSLSTGLIDTVYTPPLGAIALQWFTKTQYITDVPMANGIGSLVVSRRFFQNLPQDLQKLLKRTGEETGEKLIAATREDNIEALQTLQEKGMKLVVDTEGLESSPEITAITTRAAQNLMNNGYIPRPIVDKVNFWLLEYRTNKAKEQVDATG
ncbi:MAG TPA: TRAP transporter substrate-binding protein DctP [Gammaproteobacteria bacterium]|nr:TRAP transporter substrate-binding protein DctP [Gammaproteobacteria bacterium]